MALRRFEDGVVVDNFRHGMLPTLFTSTGTLGSAARFLIRDEGATV
jgi:hypothetical protein